MTFDYLRSYMYRERNSSCKFCIFSVTVVQNIKWYRKYNTLLSFHYVFSPDDKFQFHDFYRILYHIYWYLYTLPDYCVEVHVSCTCECQRDVITVIPVLACHKWPQKTCYTFRPLHSFNCYLKPALRSACTSECVYNRTSFNQYFCDHLKWVHLWNKKQLLCPNSSLWFKQSVSGGSVLEM